MLRRRRVDGRGSRQGRPGRSDRRADGAGSPCLHPRPASRERSPTPGIPRTTARGRHPANDRPRPARPSAHAQAGIRARHPCPATRERFPPAGTSEPRIRARHARDRITCSITTPPLPARPQRTGVPRALAPAACACSVHRSEWGQASMLLTAVPAMPFGMQRGPTADLIAHLRLSHRWRCCIARDARAPT